MPDFVIVVDTREQTPWFKKTPKGTVVVRGTLRYGDYTIKGFEDVFCIERKNPDDFISSVTSDHRRFADRLYEMAEMERAIVIVETTMDLILARCQPGKPKRKLVKIRGGGIRPVVNKDVRDVHPNSVMGAIESMLGKYGVSILFCSSPKDAELRAVNIMRKYYRFKRGG